ncbi:MAG: enoyl-CoA hydratase/isomerase family protein [Thermodesulfobacteriota bacterium]
MAHDRHQEDAPVLIQSHPALRILTLNRPQVVNSLNLAMVRSLRQALEEARTTPSVKLVLLNGAGDRGFCAGGDLKALAQVVQNQDWERARRFFREEYDLDLFIHTYPKPVVVLADGITMGGGLGLAAGADLVIATERTRMAMPETIIGFFPDVGATGWLFTKCPPGYPELLALTGVEMKGRDAVRVGLATHYLPSRNLPGFLDDCPSLAVQLPADKSKAAAQLDNVLRARATPNLPPDPKIDAWVQAHFAGQTSVSDIIASLDSCPETDQFCQEISRRLAERSPTALALTLALLRRHEGRPLPEVFAGEARAAAWIIRQPDYLEGIRARIFDKDHQPHWQPATLEEVRLDILTRRNNGL